MFWLCAFRAELGMFSVLLNHSGRERANPIRSLHSFPVGFHLCFGIKDLMFDCSTQSKYAKTFTEYNAYVSLSNPKVQAMNNIDANVFMSKSRIRNKWDNGELLSSINSQNLAGSHRYFRFLNFAFARPSRNGILDLFASHLQQTWFEAHPSKPNICLYQVQSPRALDTWACQPVLPDFDILFLAFDVHGLKPWRCSSHASANRGSIDNWKSQLRPQLCSGDCNRNRTDLPSVLQ